MPVSRIVNATPEPRVKGKVFLVSVLAAWLLCVLAGPFHTATLPLPTRTLLWGVLIGINALKWWAWYRWLGPRIPPGVWPDIALAGVGAIVLNATLPLEITWIYRAVGLDVAPGWLGLWLVAVAIAVSISTVVAVARQAAPQAEPQPPAPGLVLPRGLALKADLSRVLAISAEDHYLRLHLDGGEKPLILYRFGDALADLTGHEGLQIHRGAWVAARATTTAEREGRRWWLRLPDGTRLPVSDRHLAAVRAKGWLMPRPSGETLSLRQDGAHRKLTSG